MRKWMIAGGAVVAIGAGSLAVAVVNPLGPAGAGTVTVGQGPSTPGTGPEAPPATTPDREPGRGGPGEHWRKGLRTGPNVVREVLGELVAEGVISQEQADAIVARLEAKIEQHAKDHPGGYGHGPGGHWRGPGRGGMVIPGAIETAARTIGISEDDLVEGLKNGKTVAQIAQENGVDPQAVIDALVATANSKIDERAVAGGIPADRVEAAKRKAAEMATKFVNETPFKPGMGGKYGRHGSPGPRGFDGDDRGDGGGDSD